jgi:hypothetical protein
MPHISSKSTSGSSDETLRVTCDDVIIFWVVSVCCCCCGEEIDRLNPSVSEYEYVQ